MEQEKIFGTHTSKAAQVVERAIISEKMGSELKLLEWCQQKPNNKELLNVYLDYSELLSTFGMYHKHNGILKNKLEEAHGEIRVLKMQMREIEKEKEKLFNELGSKL